uniref:hypothetical protein n=1 Tax=Arthrobacter silvisoli TaxID=2291022 RepID=UPI003F497EC5
MSINGGKTAAAPGSALKIWGVLLIALSVFLYVVSYSQGGTGGIAQIFMLFLGAILLICGFIKANNRN